jgi:aryl-alcohol dehydrogenase-like predicted oxidoreductase
MTLYATFVEHVRPVFERLVGEGLIGAWGLTGIGHPDTIIKLLCERPAPAAVQCIANLLDSPGGLKFFEGPAKPRAVMTAAHANGVGVMGIHAAQAGALTGAIDRPLPSDHPEMRDFVRAAGFRQLAKELGVTPAALAHPYARSLAKVFEDREIPGNWRVEKMNEDGGYEVVKVFTGPDAREQTRRYAEREFGEFDEIRLEPYRRP